MFQDHSVRLFRQQPWNAKLVLRHDSFFFFFNCHFKAWVYFISFSSLGEERTLF